MRPPKNSSGIQIKIRRSEISGSSQLARTDSGAPDRHATLAGKQPAPRRDLWSASADGRTDGQTDVGTATMVAEPV